MNALLTKIRSPINLQKQFFNVLVKTGQRQGIQVQQYLMGRIKQAGSAGKNRNIRGRAET